MAGHAGGRPGDPQSNHPPVPVRDRLRRARATRARSGACSHQAPATLLAHAHESLSETRGHEATQALELAHPEHDAVPTGAVLGHHPSLAFGELRLGKPSEFVTSEGCRAVAAQRRRRFRLAENRRNCERREAIAPIRECLIHQRSARPLPSSSHARRQAIRLRSEDCQSKGPLLHRPHLGRSHPPCRPQRRPLPAHRALPPLAPSRHHRTT